MANSAFTPSTSTVTNNVPVNVPVVTGWQSYTPTGGWSSNSTYYGQWRRVGDSMEIEADVVLSGAATGTLSYFSIPSGYTIDTTKLPNAAAQSQVLGSVKIEDSGVSTYTGIVLYRDTTTLQVYWLNSTTVANISATSPFTFGASDNVTIRATVPIAEWAGSGTTTLATRAVEEYAYNTDTSTADATTGFGYGPSGQAFGSFTSNTSNGTTRKRVRFSSPILSTDNIIVEVDNGSGVWSKASESAIHFHVDGTGRYGFGKIEYINSTDVDINFGKSGASSANIASWAATNGDPWSNYTTWKWRVRKVSSGAQVGYPVSARNIVGDTSGSVVPTGMLGENYTKTGADTGLSTATTSVVSQSLSAGTWLINAGITAVSSTSNTIFVSIYQGTTSTLIGPAAGQLLGGVRGNASVSWVVTLSSTTTMGVAAFLDSGTATANGIRSFFVATRIA